MIDKSFSNNVDGSSPVFSKYISRTHWIGYTQFRIKEDYLEYHKIKASLEGNEEKFRRYSRLNRGKFEKYWHSLTMP